MCVALVGGMQGLRHKEQTIYLMAAQVIQVRGEYYVMSRKLRIRDS